MNDQAILVYITLGDESIRVGKLWFHMRNLKIINNQWVIILNIPNFMVLDYGNGEMGAL